MTEPNIIIASFIVFIATIYSYLLLKLFKIELKPVKFETIDGLRGYLAFFVFLHHASIYYYYLPASEWKLPPQNLFVHFGQTSVALFFMITGFLFFDKLIESRNRVIDWQKFYFSRFMRLYPLYLFIFPFILLIVAIRTNFQLNVDYIELISQLKAWLLFGVFENPTINQNDQINYITAGVLWSLRYEWMFYFSLAILGLLFFKQRPSIFLIVATIFLIYKSYISRDIDYSHFYTFLYGLLAAILYRFDIVKNLLKHWSFSVAIGILLFGLVYFYSEAYSLIPQLITGIVFIIIACGNSIFGLLKLKASKAFGQLAYSIYLIHGMILYVFFRMILGHELSSSLLFYQYWLVIAGLGVLLISICYFTYYKIELPGMNSTKNIILKIDNFRKKKILYILKDKTV